MHPFQARRNNAKAVTKEEGRKDGRKGGREERRTAKALRGRRILARSLQISRAKPNFSLLLPADRPENCGMNWASRQKWWELL